MSSARIERRRALTSFVWIAAVAVVTFALAETGRFVATWCCAKRVQIHTSFTVSAPAIAVLLALGAIFCCLLVRHPPRLVATAAGLYSGGALANVVEFMIAGGVADYLPVFGIVVSGGDVGAAFGASLVYRVVLGALLSKWRLRSRTACDRGPRRCRRCPAC